MSDPVPPPSPGQENITPIQTFTDPNKPKTLTLSETVAQHTEELAEQKRTTKRQEDLIKEARDFMFLVVIVCFLGFLGFLYAYFQFDANAFNTFTTTMNSVQDKQNADVEKRLEVLEQRLGISH